MPVQRIYHRIVQSKGSIKTDGPFSAIAKPLESMALQFSRVEELTDPLTLCRFLGPIEWVERSHLATPGYSGARHERLSLRLQSGEERFLVLKHIWPATDWTAYRTCDGNGREARMLGEPALRGIWEVLRCPYRAYAVQEGEIALLMDDLTPYLSDVGMPLTEEREEQLLRALASLHGRFWESGAASLPWLTPLSRRFALLGPGAAEEELHRRPGHPLFLMVRRGWEIALERLPEAARAAVMLPPDAIAQAFAHLPRTLLHGDAKIDNFAFLPEGSIAAFDWAVMGTGPATLDLGYYLAVNWQRLSRSRDEILELYRGFLEQAMGKPLPEVMWQNLLGAAVFGGSLKLLWSKALSLESGAPGAGAEWDWWVDQLLVRLGCLE